MSSPTSITQLSHALTSIGLPTPHPSFLAPIATLGPSQRLLPPLQALTATAKLRLLNANLTSPLILDPARTASLPTQIADPSIPSRVLDADTPVQVIGIEDLSKSKWEQIEALEMERKGEFAKGREVVRVVPESEDAGAMSASTQQALSAQREARGRSNGPFKLLMEDVKGQRVYGFELKRVEKVGYPPVMSIGCKIMLKRGAKVARGMVLLEPATVVVLGGKIEMMDKPWREGQEKALRDAVGDGRGGRGGSGAGTT